jgi:uncharacterized protein
LSADAGFDQLVVLTVAECLARLASGRVGRVGFVHDGQPQVLPVNYAAAPDGTVVFRSTFDSILGDVVDRPAVFEVDGLDEFHKSGWSVCVHGVGHEIAAGLLPTAEQLRRLSVISWAPGQRDRWLAVTADSITGRRIPMNLSPDEGWLPGVVA